MPGKTTNRFIPVFCSLFFLLSVFFAKAQQVEIPGDKLFGSDNVHEIKIDFLQCNYWDSLLFYKDNTLDGKYMQANVSFDGIKLFASGIRIKGESSYEFYEGKKKSFKIKFNEYIKGQDLDGLSTINLNNGFKDPSMMREKIFLDFLNKEGLPAPRCTYANLIINGENYGLYFLVENVNKTFLKQNFGNDKGNLYKGEPQPYFVYLGNDPQTYSDKYLSEVSKDSNIIENDLVGFIKAVNDSTLLEKEFKENLDKFLNTDNCLKVFALTSIFCNIDAYNMLLPHNLYLYFEKESNRFEWIPYYANYSFCAWSPTLTLKDAEKLSIFYMDKSYPKPLCKAFFSNMEYKKYLLFQNPFRFLLTSHQI